MERTPVSGEDQSDRGFSVPPELILRKDVPLGPSGTTLESPHPLPPHPSESRTATSSKFLLPCEKLRLRGGSGSPSLEDRRGSGQGRRVVPFSP